MPTYIVNRRSWFAGLGLVEQGTPVEWDGLPGTNLDPTDKAGEDAKAEAARVRQAAAAAVQAADQMARSFRQATVDAFTPTSSSFAAQATAEAPEARRDKSGVLRPADQVPEGDQPGPSPSTGHDIPPDSSTFVPAGIVAPGAVRGGEPPQARTEPQPGGASTTTAATMPTAAPPPEEEEEDEPPPPRRRTRKPAEPGGASTTTPPEQPEE